MEDRNGKVLRGQTLTKAQNLSLKVFRPKVIVYFCVYKKMCQKINLNVAFRKLFFGKVFFSISYKDLKDFRKFRSTFYQLLIRCTNVSNVSNVSNVQGCCELLELLELEIVVVVIQNVSRDVTRKLKSALGNYHALSNNGQCSIGKLFSVEYIILSLALLLLRQCGDVELNPGPTDGPGLGQHGLGQWANRGSQDQYQQGRGQPNGNRAKKKEKSNFQCKS